MPARLLHAEDDPAIARWVTAALRASNMAVESVENGIEALQRLRDHPGDYSLLILDLIMPGMNGLEVLSSIRSRADTRRLPVLVTTGSFITANQFGNDLYVSVLRKPFTTEQLRLAIGQALLLR